MGALSRALTLALSVGLVGCTVQTTPLVVGGSTPVAAPAAVPPASQVSQEPAELRGYGWLNLNVRWPEQTGYNVALLPTTTNAIAITLKKGDSLVGTPTIVSRTPGASAATASIRVEAASNLSVEIKAYRETAPNLATAVPIAQNTGVVNVVRSKVTPLSLTLNPLNVPTVQSFDHNVGRPGDTITVTGSNFGSGTVPVPVVTFNGVAATTVTRTSETSIAVAVPTGARTGNVVVKADGVESQSVATFWVGADFQIFQPIKETWDTTTSTKRLIFYGRSVQFSERHTWALKDGESADLYGPEPALTWSLSSEAAGTLGLGGLFTAATTSGTSSLSAQIGTWTSNALELKSVGVNAVTLSQTSLTLNALPPDGSADAGYTTSALLSAIVDTSAPFNGGVSWSSSDPSTVTVSGGLVATTRDAAEGTVIITATSVDDTTKKATASVTVTRIGDLELGIE